MKTVVAALRKNKHKLPDYSHTFLCASCEVNLWVPDLKAVDRVACPNCGQKYVHGDGPYFRKAGEERKP